MQSNVTVTGGVAGEVLMTPGVYRARSAATALVVSLALAAAHSPAQESADVRVSSTRRLMGVAWRITVHAPSAEAGREAIAAGFGEVARLERILSDYDPTSELCRLSAAAPSGGPVPVGEDLWRVLARSVEIRDATGGAFDPTVGPLTTLWRQARRSGRLPPPEKLAVARSAVGPDTLWLVTGSQGVVLGRPGMRLDLGGIGMGYAADRAIEVLERHGIRSALIDASGDVRASGPPPGSAGWRVSLAPLAVGNDPEASRGKGPVVVLSHAAVTTSGDAYQAVEIDGRRYSHVVDPRTGLGVSGPAAVTVVAPDCTTADAMATAASVLGPEAGSAAIEREPGCAARFVWIEDGTERTADTARWSAQVSHLPP